MNILIINGPNLNLLGKREKSVYGENSFESYLEFLRNKYSEHQLVYFQSNIEGELINTLHQYGFGDTDGIVLNAGAYTHTSIAISCYCDRSTHFQHTCTRGLPPHLYDCGRMQRLNSRFRHGFIQTGYRSINQ